MSRRGLQIVVGAIAVVALIAGTASLLTGAATIPGGDNVSPSVDSEIRFYATWYIAAGILLFRAVSRVESETWLIRVVGGTFFAAACGRVISWVGRGAPEPLFLFLMTLEFAIPLVIIPWQAMVARHEHSASTERPT